MAAASDVSRSAGDKSLDAASHFIAHAKRGSANLASDAHHAAELQEYEDWPHSDFAARVFDLAGMDFGRLDSSIARGRPRAHEVNANPGLKISTDHHNADWRLSLERYRADLVGGLAAIATPGRGWLIDVPDPLGPAPRAVMRRPLLF